MQLARIRKTWYISSVGFLPCARLVAPNDQTGFSLLLYLTYFVPIHAPARGATSAFQLSIVLLDNSVNICFWLDWLHINQTIWTGAISISTKFRAPSSKVLQNRSRSRIISLEPPNGRRRSWYGKHYWFYLRINKNEHAPIVVGIRGNPSKPILSYSLLYANTLSYRIKGTDEGGNHPVPVNSIKPLLKLQVELMRPTFEPDRHPSSALLYR